MTGSYDQDLAPTRWGPLKRLAVATAVVLLAFGVSFGYVFGVGRSGTLVSARPFTPETKRTIVAELESALAVRDTQAMYPHVRRAGFLAATRGQRRLAIYLQLVFSSGCAAASHYYGLVHALEIARESPTVPVSRRSPTLRPGSTRERA